MNYSHNLYAVGQNYLTYIHFYKKSTLIIFIAMSTQMESKQKQQNIPVQSSINRQNKFPFQAYAQVYWDTVYIDQKYYIAHPLALDKLMKLESEIKMQKNKLNINEKLEQQAQDKNDDNITEKSQIENHRPISALSRQCKTEINEINDVKSKIDIEKQLLMEQEKYKKRVQQASKKKQSSVLKASLQRPKNNAEKQDINKKQIIDEKKRYSKISQKSQKQIQNQKQSQKQSNRSNLSASRNKNQQKNYISFHPNEAVQSPRFEGNKSRSKKLTQIQIQDQQVNRNCTNSNLRQSANASSKQGNKSFVINYKKSASKDKDIKQQHSNARKDLKSASSATSRLQLQTLNKKIKQMQYKLIEVQQRQMQFQQLQKQKLLMKHESNKNKKLSKNQSSETQAHRIYDLQMKRKSHQRYNQQLTNQPSPSIQKSGKLNKLDSHVQSNKSSNNDVEEQKPAKQRPMFDFTLYKNKKLNLASTTVSYNYTDDWKKIKKERQEAQQKQKMNEQISQLKKMIRQLKFQRIRQQNMIQQLQKKQKQKQSINNLLNSKLEQKSMEISKLNSRLTTQKRQKTEHQQKQVQRQRQSQRQRQRQSQRQKQRQSQKYMSKQMQKQKMSQNSQKFQNRQTKKNNVIFDSENNFQQSPVIKKQKIQKLPPIKSQSKRNIKQSLNISPKKQITKLHINSQVNPQQGTYRQYHPYPLSKKGIVVRQVLGSQKDNQQESNNINLSNRYHQHIAPKDKNYQPTSPTNTGRKIFELQFVKQTKKKNKFVQQQEPKPSCPNIKVQGFNIPNLPDTPQASISQTDLLYLAKYICQVFNIKVQSDDHIYMKKYKNCIIFKTPDVKKSVVWHYSGKFYIGGWDQNQIGQGKKNGQGFQFVPQKYYYQGQFLQGKKNGSGVMMNLNGNIYRGQWVKGLKHGLGVYYQKSTGAIYQGEWKQDKKDGKGVLKLSDVQFYDGTFVKSVKHGYGIQMFSNGDYYKGQYKNGRFHGKGKYIWKNGACYDGTFIEGRRQGMGQWRSDRKDFDTYYGEYKNDKKSGKGQYTWNNGCVYDGYFINDLKHGEGRVQYPDGREIRGYWQSGKLIEVDQNIDQSQTNSNKNQPMGKPTNKMMQISSKQLQPSRTLTRI